MQLVRWKVSRYDNTGWEVYDSKCHGVGREWEYMRRKRHSTGWEVQLINGKTQFSYGPSGDFIERIESSYFIPVLDLKSKSK